jgi:hypothetical protein
MRLTLTYRGALPPKQRGVSTVKAQLRRAFHPQIKANVGRLLTSKNEHFMTTEVGGHSFVSPVHPQFRTAAELDILLLTAKGLRPGDVDNRLKTLIDGLTRPGNPEQLQGFTQPDEGGPTFCLLDDDRYVTRINLDTRTWHEPNLDRNEAMAVVTATLVLSPDATMNTPVQTLFFLVS